MMQILKRKIFHSNAAWTNANVVYLTTNKRAQNTEYLKIYIKMRLCVIIKNKKTHRAYCDYWVAYEDRKRKHQIWTWEGEKHWTWGHRSDSLTLHSLLMTRTGWSPWSQDTTLDTDCASKDKSLLEQIDRTITKTRKGQKKKMKWKYLSKKENARVRSIITEPQVVLWKIINRNFII